ncbi:MAG: acyl-CoA dehydrogenase family protein [SAR86 cluster bacterium]|nr:acyl-CoA dehydrogenase family protein [SAR86 cluster bacterium]|tara:strand:- start:4068 stop:5285 length:1218 start_codon:yes stop_codon:yes gene_type:complete
MQISPIPTLSEKINNIRLRTADIVANRIIPNESTIYAGGDKSKQLRKEINSEVKKQGLWAPHLPEEYGGMGLAFLEHAYMNEVLAWSPLGNRLFGVIAPNSGNQKILVKYGTEEQKKKWLEPLIEQKIESCFSMTEPDQPGSDPRSLQTTAKKEGDEWVINGHKIMTSNGERADFAIVMCRTEEEGDEGNSNSKMTQIIVPTDAVGFNKVRSVPIWGHTGGDHLEIIYDNVRVPLENALGSRGSGHQAAQDRLGAGRIYHCMNTIGQMWRAFDLMVKYSTEREVHGGKLETKQFVQGFIADSYIDIQAARLMTIHCAEVMDKDGDPRVDISAIKVFVPAAGERVIDRAIQCHGWRGVSGDTPLAGMFQGFRTLRLADGPDEVHRILIAKQILKKYHDGLSWDFGV